MENKTVLVAEDNAPTRELINLILIKFGYTVIVATTGIEALKKARAKLPNLIIMDLGLPGITGDEAVLCLKTDPITKYIPVIVNTAYHEGSVHVERAIIAGAAEILYKPNNFQALPHIVNQYLSTEKIPDISDNRQFLRGPTPGASNNMF